MSIYNKFHGEIQKGKPIDLILREYYPDYNYKGVFFDVGAYEPINISNSYHFEMNGWDTYCFEANSTLINELKNHRKNVYNYAIAETDKDTVEFNIVHGGWGGGSLTAGVSAINLDEDYMRTFKAGIRHIEKISVPQFKLDTVIEKELNHINKIDIMSIDVEGGELNVLKGLNLLKYKPSIICVENFFNKNDVYDYLIQNNYILDKHIDYNQYYKLL